jgi:hypothetical protein
MNVDADTGGAVMSLAALRVAATSVVGAVNAMDKGVSAGGARIAIMGGLAATAAALFTPLIGALASVGALAAGAGIGLAAVAGPLIAVVSRLKEYHESLDQVSSAQDSAASAADSLASANRAVETAERSRASTLEQLEVATESLEAAQRDLNYALEDEPLNQEAAEIELARARDRVTDATNAYNEAVKEHGANSEEARDAALDLREAENDLALQSNETTRIREDGSEQLQAAKAAEESASRGVEDAERAVADATRQVAEAQLAAAQAAKAHAAAEQDVLDKVVKLTPAQQQLYDVAIRTGAALNKAFTGAQDAAARFATAVLRDVRPSFSVLNNVAVAAIKSVQFAWQELVAQMNMPVQRQSTTALLGISPEIIRMLTMALGSFAMGLMNLLANAAPAALKLAGFIEKIAFQFLAWSRSQGAIRAVNAAIQAAVPVFSALWNLVLKVGGALFQFGVRNAPAVAQAINILTAGLTMLINAFSWLTQRFGAIIPLTTALAPVLLIIVLIIGQVAGAITGIVGAFFTFGGAIVSVIAALGGPLTLALIALAAAAILIIRNWDKVKAAFNTLQPAIQRVISVFKAMWVQIRPIVTAIANGVRTAMTTAFRFLAGQVMQLWTAFKKAWPGIRNAVLPVVTAISRVLRGALVAVFRFVIQQANVVVNWFKKNWPLIKRTSEVVFNAVKAVVTANLRAVWSIVKAVVGPLIAFWRNNWNTIRAIIVAVWNIIKTTISTAIKTVLNVIKLTMQIITGDWRGAWTTIKTILADAWSAMKSNVENVIKIIQNVLKLAWEAIKSVAGAAWDGIKEAIGQRIDETLQRIQDFVEALKGALNTVLKLVGLPALGEGDGSGSGKGKKTGNSPSGGGTNKAAVRGFAEGGRVRAQRGGVYRVAEGGEDEWVINPKSANYERHLRGAAAEGGFRVVRSAGAAGRTHRGARRNGFGGVTARGRRGLFPPWRAFGAEALGPTMHTYTPEMQKFVDGVNAKFPVYTNTYSNHPPGYEQPYYRERSMDIWGTGGRGSDLSDALHEQTVPYTIDTLGSNLNWLISNGRMLTSAGWGPDTSGYDHYSHQHTTAFAEGPTAHGGGSGGNLKRVIFDAAWKRLVDPIVDQFLDPLRNSSFVPAQAAGAGGEKIVGSIKNWILEKIGGLGGTSGEGLSGTPQENRQLGQKMFPASGLDGSFSSVDAIWTQESGWDHTAQNPTSSAFGIPQFLDSTWQQYGGKSYDAEGQIRKGYMYIGDRYDGSADKALEFKEANGWYDRGGMITRTHQAIVDPGELYLPLESRQVQKSAQTALGTAELRAENARYHRELMHRLGRVGLADETIRQQALVAKSATIGTLYSRDGLEAHSVNTLKAERRDRIASV